MSEAVWTMSMRHEERMKAAMKRTHERHDRKEAWLRQRAEANAMERAETMGLLHHRGHARRWGKLGYEDEDRIQSREDHSGTNTCGDHCFLWKKPRR